MGDKENPCMNGAALSCMMSYIDDSEVRDAISLVCRRWYEVDARTRKHVTIHFCDSTTPELLERRFSLIESLKVKGLPGEGFPWFSLLNYIAELRKCYVTPWVNQIARSLNCLKSVHFRRMLINDSDLETLTQHRGGALLHLKLEKCNWFSTDGLLHISRFCSNLRTLSLEGSEIDEKDGQWLHVLAVNNSALETLNLYMTYLHRYSVQDLELIARNCPSLVSVKIGHGRTSDLAGFFHAALALQEFGCNIFQGLPESSSNMSLPSRVHSVGLTSLEKNNMPILFPVAFQLRKLDIRYASFDVDDYCRLIPMCTNLEVLEVSHMIGDRGLEMLAQFCKRLRRLRVGKSSADAMFNVGGVYITQRGLIALSEGCLELEFLDVFVSDISNAALESIGTHLKDLYAFHLVLLDTLTVNMDLPLDDGVRALLMGGKKIRRLSLSLREVGLTDIGLDYIGQHGQNIQGMFLRSVGQSDAGLVRLSMGCMRLQKLVMRDCPFSENGLATAAINLTSIRLLWFMTYRVRDGFQNLLAMARPSWNIEVIPLEIQSKWEYSPRMYYGKPAHILAYYSLGGPRTDFLLGRRA